MSKASKSKAAALPAKAQAPSQVGTGDAPAGTPTLPPPPADDAPPAPDDDTDGIADDDMCAMLAPDGANECSYEGTTYLVDRGEVRVPQAAVSVLQSHGFELLG